ncbi:zinc ribbon domain-containing protein [Gemmata sp.]|uniref:zinc ribbon domain-containing protein n=1 Tax=Gemmata sp. TaxID=1914242 RepID=UPI003F72E126
MLRRNGATGGATVRGAFGSLLKGLLKCGPCGCAMSPTHTTKGARRYRYYACVAAQNKGRATCPTKAVPAEPVEQFVVDQVRAVGRDPAVLRGVLDQARAVHAERTAELETEESGLTKDLTAWHREATRLSVQLRPGGDNGDVVGRLAELHERIGTVEGRVTRVRDQIKSVAAQLIDEGAAASALAAFDPVWGTLTPREQARVVGLLVETVGFDGRTGTVAVTFRPAGITTLAKELTQHALEEDVA